MHPRNDIPSTAQKFPAVSLHMYIASSYFILICRFDGGFGGLVMARIRVE